MSGGERVTSPTNDRSLRSAPSGNTRATSSVSRGGRGEVLGLTFGRYEGLIRLAAGGMGQVLVARVQSERGVRRLVALKTILAHLTDNELFLKMFIREAEIASRLHHPNVVPVLELGRTDDEHFLVMEYFPSVPLNAVLRESLKQQRPMPWDVAAAIVADAAGGLHAAHELTDDDGNLLHLVHRDATPSNLLVGADGSVKVTDFGVAKATGANFENMTVSGDLRGKIGYLSPEQVTGEMIDRRSDVFTLGIVLWECLAGRRLFGRKDSEVAAIRALMDEEIPDVRDAAPSCPEPLARIVTRALERDRNRRYQSAAELRQALTTQLLADTDRTRSNFAKQTIGEILAERQRTIAAAVAELDSPNSAARKFAQFDALPEPTTNTQQSLGSNVSGTARTVPPPRPNGSRAGIIAASVIGVLGLAAGGGVIAMRSQRATASAPSTPTQSPGQTAGQTLAQSAADAAVVAAATAEDAAVANANANANANADSEAAMNFEPESGAIADGGTLAQSAQPDSGARRSRGRHGSSGEHPTTTTTTTTTTPVVTPPERIEM